MTLEEFLLDIHTSIYEYKNIITNDIRLINLLDHMKNGLNIFDYLSKNAEYRSFIQHRSLDSLKELGKFLIIKKKFKYGIIKQLVYPMCLSILLIINSILFGFFGLFILFTPMLIMIGMLFIYNNSNIKLYEALRLFWIIKLLDNKINIHTFLEIINNDYVSMKRSQYISIHNIRSLNELIMQVKGSSLKNINILNNQYKDLINDLNKHWEYNSEILAKVSTIFVGFNIIYIMNKFYNSIM